MEIKTEFIKTGEKYLDIMDKLRTECIDYLKAMVTENGEIEFGEDDPYVTVTYDGGRHPEYNANPYSQLHQIYLKDNRLMFDIDDDDEYDEDRVPVDELYDIASAVYEMYDDSPRDINGNVIKTGDTVIWTDPADRRRKVKYVVFGEPNSEMVKLHSDYGECEALPEECEIIETT